MKSLMVSLIGLGLLLNGCNEQDKLEVENDALRRRVAQLEATLQELTPVLSAAKRLGEVVTINEAGDVVITGANVYIQNGDGQTDDLTTNGKGNLIIGYDEPDQGGASLKTGSHNLIIGKGHSYTGVGAIVAGEYNRSLERYASVLGGHGNEALQYHAVVVGGSRNNASGTFSATVGGSENQAKGIGAIVVGGSQQRASSDGEVLLPTRPGPQVIE